MFHKIFFSLAFTLFVSILFAQQDQQNDSIPWYDFGARMYNPLPCGDCPDKYDHNKQPKYLMENPFKYFENSPVIMLDSLFNYDDLWLLKKEVPIYL